MLRSLFDRNSFVGILREFRRNEEWFTDTIFSFDMQPLILEVGEVRIDCNGMNLKSIKSCLGAVSQPFALSVLKMFAFVRQIIVFSVADYSYPNFVGKRYDFFGKCSFAFYTSSGTRINSNS